MAGYNGEAVPATVVFAPPTTYAGDTAQSVASSGAVVTYRNRAWDPTAGGHVRWETTGGADPTGTAYPGPDLFANTSGYCIEAIL